MRSIFIATLTLAGFLISWSTATGQTKFVFSAMVTPFYGQIKTTTTVMVPTDDGSGTITSQVWKSKSSPKGYWIGLNGRYSFSQKWSASTGLWFKESRLKISNSKGRSHNFSIPIMVNFQPSKRKLSPYFSAGALWNFETTSHVKIPDVGTVVFKSESNTSRTSPMIGAGVIYHFARHLSLIAQPTFSYAIPPSGFDSHAYQMGLNVQLMVKL